MMFRKYLFYFSGQLGLMLHMRFFFQWIIDFAGGGVEGLAIVSTATLGFVLFVFRFLDAVTDPMSGMFSDYVVSKGGNRSTILLWGAPLLPIGLILCFSISSEYSSYYNWIVLLLGLFLFFTSYTLYCIPYWSLVGDYSGDDAEIKSKLSSLLGQGLFVATAIGFVVTPLLIEAFGYMQSAMIISLLSFPLLLLPAFSGFVPRNQITGNQTTGSQESTRFSLESVFNGFISPLRERAFLGVLVYFVGSQMAFTVLTAVAPLYVVQVLGESRSYVSVVMVPVVVLAIITFALLPAAMRKYHWSILLHKSSLFLGIVFILSGVIYAPLFIPVKYQAVLLFALIGPLIAIVLGVEAFAITESGKEDARTGMYFGAFNFVIKGMNGVALWGTGVTSELVLKSGDPAYIRILLGYSGILVIFLSFVGCRLLKKDSKFSAVKVA